MKSVSPWLVLISLAGLLGSLMLLRSALFPSRDASPNLAHPSPSELPRVPQTDADWDSFLRQFNAELLADPEILETVEEDLGDGDWLGFSPASTEQVAELERRLGKRLPNSYRNFLLSSNGWRTTSWNTIRLLPSSEVAWLRDVDPSLISIWTEPRGARHVPDATYFNYEDSQDSTDLRHEYFPDLLVISDTGWANQDYLLLNPRVVFPNGEWEAWHFSSEYPGAYRYQSFGELMRHEYESLERDPQ